MKETPLIWSLQTQAVDPLSHWIRSQSGERRCRHYAPHRADEDGTRSGLLLIGANQLGHIGLDLIGEISAAVTLVFDGDGGLVLGLAHGLQEQAVQPFRPLL